MFVSPLGFTIKNCRGRKAWPSKALGFTHFWFLHYFAFCTLLVCTLLGFANFSVLHTFCVLHTFGFCTLSGFAHLCILYSFCFCTIFSFAQFWRGSHEVYVRKLPQQTAKVGNNFHTLFSYSGKGKILLSLNIYQNVNIYPLSLKRCRLDM